MKGINSLKRHKLPTLTQGEIDNLHRPISIKEIESITKNIPKGNTQAHMFLLENSIITLRKE